MMICGNDAVAQWIAPTGHLSSTIPTKHEARQYISRKSQALMRGWIRFGLVDIAIILRMRTWFL
jgi:hypothetical protein